MRYFAVPLRFGDVLGFTRGSFLVCDYGYEPLEARFAQAFRALPAVVFEDIAAEASSPLVKVRHARFDGKEYFYAINTGDTPARVTLELPPGTMDLVTQERLSPNDASGKGTFDLQAYELRAFSAPR
jgi:hypothetical protein